MAENLMMRIWDSKTEKTGQALDKIITAEKEKSVDILFFFSAVDIDCL
jgi:hypothetical protein